MSFAMLHGLGDCTPSLNCGCLDPQPRRRVETWPMRAGDEVWRFPASLADARLSEAPVHGQRLDATGYYYLGMPADVLAAARKVDAAVQREREVQAEHARLLAAIRRQQACPRHGQPGRIWFLHRCRCEA